MRRWARPLFLGGLLAVALWFARPVTATPPAERRVWLAARSFAFEPAVLRVNQGDRILLTFESTDVTHGVYIDGYDLQTDAHVGQPTRIEFVASKPGTFRLRCAVPCGVLHPFMIGTLIVEPGHPLRSTGGAGIVVLVGLVAAALLGVGPASGAARPRQGWRLPLRGTGWLDKLLRWRGLQPALTLPMLFGFVLVILTGLLGTPVGGKNLAIVLVWIVWWVLLMLVLVPLGGRLWCAICPLPVPGEWLQRRGIVRRRGGEPLSLALKWPRKLDNIWLQNAAFLCVAIFSAIILTRPRATGWVLLSFLVLPVGLSLIFERRSFCRYLCPVGGFVGLYALLAPLGLRPSDPEVCRTHREKECYFGSEAGHGCPWLVHPWSLRRNAYCGLCTECIKTCPKDNLSLVIQPFGADVGSGAARLDEAYKGVIMLTCALVYSAVFLGPWAWLKDLANSSTLAGRAQFAVAFLAMALLVVPGLFLGAVALSRRAAAGTATSLKHDFARWSYALLPLGLGAWMAFSVSILLVSGSYALSVISDPFGWGWNLLGTASYPWTPVFTGALPYLQFIVLAGGLYTSVRTAMRIQRDRSSAETASATPVLPIAAFALLVTIVFVRLYVG